MKHTGLLVVVGGILVTVVLCTGSTAPAPAPSEQSQVEELKKEVDSLRQRVESLEKQVKAPFSVVPIEGRESPTIIKPPSPSRRDWHPFEFNGMTYYVVPVATPKVPIQEPANSHASAK